MAGKKSSGKHYVSKGERPSVKRSTINAVRNSHSEFRKLGNIIKAYTKGQNPWITVPNPNTMERNKKFIRVRTNDWFCGNDNRDNVYKMAGS